MAKSITTRLILGFNILDGESKAFNSSVPMSDSLDNVSTVQRKSGKAINTLESCLHLGTRETAAYLAVKSIQKKWPWMEVTIVDGTGVLEVTFSPKYEDGFNKLLKERKILQLVQDNYEDLSPVLTGLIEKYEYSEFGATVMEMMAKVRLESLECSQEEKGNKKFIKKNLKLKLNIKKGKQKGINNELVRTSEAETVKDAITCMGPTGKEADHVEHCLEIGPSATAGIALYIAARSISNRWDLMKITNVNKANILEVTIPDEFEDKFDELSENGKILSVVRDDFVNLEENLMGIVGFKTFEAIGDEVLDELNGVEVESIEGHFLPKKEPRTDNDELRKTIKLQLTSDGQRVSLTSDFDTVISAMTSHGTVKEQLSWVENCVKLDKAAPTATALCLAGRIITNRYSWMQISHVTEGNTIHVTIPREKEERFNNITKRGKINKLVREDFQDLQSTLPGIMDAQICKSLGIKIAQVLEGIDLESLDSEGASATQFYTTTVKLSIEQSGEDATANEAVTLTSDIKGFTKSGSEDLEGELFDVEKCLRQGSAATTILVISKSLSKKWPWITITAARKGNLLELTVPADKKDNLNKMLESGRLYEKVGDDIEDLQSILQGILQDDDTFLRFGSDITDQLGNVRITGLDKWKMDDDSNTIFRNKSSDNETYKIRSKNAVSILNGNRTIIGEEIEGEKEETVTEVLEVICAPVDIGKSTNIVGTHVKKGGRLTTTRIGGSRYIGAQPPPEIQMEYAKQNARQWQTVKMQITIRSRDFDRVVRAGFHSNAKIREVKDEIKRQTGNDVELRQKGNATPLKDDSTLKEEGIKENDVLCAVVL